VDRPIVIASRFDRFRRLALRKRCFGRHASGRDRQPAISSSVSRYSFRHDQRLDGRAQIPSTSRSPDPRLSNGVLCGRGTTGCGHGELPLLAAGMDVLFVLLSQAGLGRLVHRPVVPKTSPATRDELTQPVLRTGGPILLCMGLFSRFCSGAIRVRRR